MNQLLKRTLDLIVSLVLLIVLSPVLAILIIVISWEMGFPFYFVQTRAGKNGKPFKMIKFRSMTNARDEKGNLLPNDERLTPFGKSLRSTSLDELPELINVLKGEMSLVGPRPLLMKYLPRYNEVQKRRHEVKPGITGWAQVNGRNKTTWEDRFNLDVWYVDNHNLFLDLKILWLTAVKVFRREGTTPEGQNFMKEFMGTNKTVGEE